MAVLSFEVQHLEQVAQLVVAQPRPHQAYILQCVEITGTHILQFKASVLPQEVVAKYLVVIFHVVAHESLALAVVHEELQPFGSRVALAAAVDFEHRIGVAAHGLGQCLVGLEDDVERTPHYPALPHGDGGNLYDVVVLGVEAGGLGVEDDELLGIVGVDELLQVRRVVVAQEVGGQQCHTAHVAHEVAGGGVGGHHFQPPQQSGPGYEDALVGEHAEVGQHEAHGWQREEVGAADFEVGYLHGRHHLAHLVGLAVGAYEDGDAAVGCHLPVAFGEACGVVALELCVAYVEQTEVLGCVWRVALGGGQQVAADAEVAHREVVLQVEEVLRRAVVGVQVVYMALATPFQGFEGFEFGTDEREDGLLLVAEVHDGGVVGGEEVHQRQLQRVEVLHLVNLYPGVFPPVAVRCICPFTPCHSL